MNIVAIGAHPDDVEIGMAGTLARFVKEGHDVHIVHMVKSGYYDPINKKVWRTDEECLAQADKAAKIIGAKLHMFNFKDRNVPFNEESVVMLDSFFREYNIDSVYTHWTGDSHQDHINTLRSVLAAARYIDNIYMFEQVPLPRASAIQTAHNFFVNISDYMDIKIKAVNVYDSEVQKHGTGLTDCVTALARFRGAQCGKTYAEAFDICKSVV